MIKKIDFARPVPQMRGGLLVYESQWRAEKSPGVTPALAGGWVRIGDIAVPLAQVIAIHYAEETAFPCTRCRTVFTKRDALLQHTIDNACGRSESLKEYLELVGASRKEAS